MSRKPSTKLDADNSDAETSFLICIPLQEIDVLGNANKNLIF